MALLIAEAASVEQLVIAHGHYVPFGIVIAANVEK
jgi:hypothetical protein